MYASTYLRRFVLALSLAAVTCCSIQAGEGNPSHEPTVHLVAIGDMDVGMKEKDGRKVHTYFGLKVADDARNIVTTFAQAFSNAGKADRLNSRLILGKDVTPESVLKVIADLQVQPQDAVVVLYSGHGEMRPGNEHVLTFRHGDLARDRLLAAIQAKAPRLTVVLTDCCSGGVVAPSKVKRYEPKAMQEGAVMQWSTVQTLLLSHSGLVDISAAEPGFCGRLDTKKPGSLFTNALVRVLKTPYAELVRHLDRDRDAHLQWDEVLPQLRGLAASYDLEQNGEAHQQAYATSLGRWMPIGENAPR